MDIFMELLGLYLFWVHMYMIVYYRFHLVYSIGS